VRTYVGSSLATTPVEALLEVADRLRAQGFVAGRTPVGFALCFVSQGLLDPGAVDGEDDGHGATTPDMARGGVEHAAVHAALGDLLEHLPFIGFVGRSAFHDQRIPEGRPGLVVIVFAGADHEALEHVVAEARQALLHEHGMQTAGPLLADGAFSTARFVAINGAGATGGGNILAELHSAGGDTVGGVTGLPVRHLQPGVALLSTSLVRVVAATSHTARLLGPTRTITSAATNTIRELDGRPALEMLMADLPEPLRTRIAGLGGALFCHFDIDDGDAGVLRTVTGIDVRTGAVALAERPRVGAEVAFSLRDQDAARADLEEALSALEGGLAGRQPLAFVVFSSTTRDAGLFGAPLWDVTRILSRFGPDIPVVGCSTRMEVATFARQTLAFSQSVVVAAVLPAG
jgi:small ligand-binding sensory domain FIST